MSVSHAEHCASAVAGSRKLEAIRLQALVKRSDDGIYMVSTRHPERSNFIVAYVKSGVPPIEANIENGAQCRMQETRMKTIPLVSSMTMPSRSSTLNIRPTLGIHEASREET